VNRGNILKRCIIFFGPDGSGKTTHSELLSDLLKEKGQRVLNVRIRANHTFSFVLIKAMQKLGLMGQNIFTEGLNARLAKKLSRVWPFIEFGSIVPLVIVRVWLPLKLGCTVVCERYVIDTIVSVAYMFNNPNLVTGFREKIILGFIPKSSATVYMTAEEKLLLTRRKDEPVTPEYISFQIGMYNRYARKLNAISIDTSKIERNSVQQILRAKLQSES
jgi:thymidylate kinase